MPISIVQRVTFTATGATSPSSAAISPTGAGNTLVFVESTGQFGNAPEPFLNGLSLLGLGGSVFAARGLNVYVLTNVTAGYSSITWPNSPVPALAVIYELTPCTLDANSSGFGNTTGSETAPAITASGTGEFFINGIGSSGGGSGQFPEIFSSVSSPWTTDYVGQLAGGIQGAFRPGVTLGVGLIASSSGTKQAVWTSSPGGFTYGTASVVFAPSGGGGGGGGNPPISSGNPPGIGGIGGSGSGCSTTLNISPATDLYTSFVPAAAMTASGYNTEGRKAVVIDFNSGDGIYSRDIETLFSWGISSHYVLRVWQPSLIPMPENQFNRPTDWEDGGHAGNKFIQGVIIEADSFAVAKNFQLQSSDDLSLHTLNEVPATFAKQTTIPFSCVAPFLAHSVRVVATDQVAWRVWKVNLVFQPWPEQTVLWQGEMTSLGMMGWAHAREFNIGYASANPITITLTFDFWPTITINLPSSGGSLVRAKTKVTLPPNKFKLVQPQVSSTAPFFLFMEDLEFKVKQWGSTGPYTPLKIVGGPTKEGALV